MPKIEKTIETRNKFGVDVYMNTIWVITHEVQLALNNSLGQCAEKCLSNRLHAVEGKPNLHPNDPTMPEAVHQCYEQPEQAPVLKTGGELARAQSGKQRPGVPKDLPGKRVLTLPNAKSDHKGKH